MMYPPGVPQDPGAPGVLQNPQQPGSFNSGDCDFPLAARPQSQGMQQQPYTMQQQPYAMQQQPYTMQQSQPYAMQQSQPYAMQQSQPYAMQQQQQPYPMQQQQQQQPPVMLPQPTINSLVQPNVVAPQLNLSINNTQSSALTPTASSTSRAFKVKALLSGQMGEPANLFQEIKNNINKQQQNALAQEDTFRFIVSYNSVTEEGPKCAIATHLVQAMNSIGFHNNSSRRVVKKTKTGVYYSQGNSESSIKLDVIGLQTKDGYDILDPTELSNNSGEELTAVCKTTHESTCFPASSKVSVRNGDEKQGVLTTKPFSELKQGDWVAVGNGRFSRVLLWSHRELNTNYQFVEIVTEQAHTLRLTHGHYLPVHKKCNREDSSKCSHYETPKVCLLMEAAAICVGDEVTVVDCNNCATQQKVSHVCTVWDTGLLNVQTDNGFIVVNGVLASCNTSDGDLWLIQKLVRKPLSFFAQLGDELGIDIVGGIFKPQHTIALSRAWGKFNVGWCSGLFCMK